MNLDFLKPRELIKSGYSEPNLSLSVLFVLLPFIMVFLIGLIYGFPIDLMDVGLSVINYLLFWFIGGILLFVLIYVLKGKKAEFNLKGILFNLSLISVIYALIFIISVSGLFLLNAEIFSEMSFIANNVDSTSEMIELVSEIPLIESGLSFNLFLLVSLIGVLLLFYSFYLRYLIISVTRKEWIAKNIIILIIYIIFELIVLRILF